MRKSVKVVLGIVTFIIGNSLIIGAFWNGTFNNMHRKEIETYTSPNSKYLLVFEQMDDPQWSFGPTDVRLTLKYQNGQIIEHVPTQLSDDGANASEHNIVSITWDEDAVIVILRASEMKDQEILIKYKESYRN